MRTVPVKYSAGPFPEGCEPLLLISIFMNSSTLTAFFVQTGDTSQSPPFSGPVTPGDNEFVPRDRCRESPFARSAIPRGTWTSPGTARSFLRDLHPSSTAIGPGNVDEPHKAAQHLLAIPSRP